MPMASLNVAEWSADQVADWLSGLGPTVARYVPALRERGLDGAKLLTLRCDDLEYLGMHVIGHQELLLEAVEHLRNFQYEVSRECVQQLALRVSVVATTLARALRHHTDARLETQTLADVARTVHAVKPLVCWLDRWPLCPSGSVAASLAERKAALLKLSLEAATCAQRDRFAEQPARAVAAAAATTAATADYIIQDVSDPMILQPASLDTVTLRQAGKPLGFDVVPSFCGHHQLADIRFGSPAHASGAVHIGDEIVQVGNQCVIGWSGEAVVRACSGAGAELALRLRRRAARAPPALATPQLHRRALRLHHYRPPHLYADLSLHSRCGTLSPLPASPPADEEPAAAPAPDEAASSSSDESEPLSPPASPTHLHLDHARMYPPKPRSAVQRRHTISGDTPLYKRPSHTIEQFWQELKQQRWGHEGGSTSISPAPDDIALYARDKAVSCSTGLELSPRPRTCLGVVPARPAPAAPGPLAPAPAHALAPAPAPLDELHCVDRNRGKLDKSHSTPAYDFDASIEEPGPLAAQTIPESPTTPTDSPLTLHLTDKADRILDFKKSSSQIGEAILQRGRRSNADERSVPTETDDRADSDALAPERDEASTERILETINIAMMEHRRRSGLPAPPGLPGLPGPPGLPASPSQPGPPGLPSSPADTAPRFPRSRSARAPEPPPRPTPAPRPPGAAPPPPGSGPAPPPPGSGPAPPPPGPFAVLRAVPRNEAPPTSPLKPIRLVDTSHISVPLRHITKHDIRMIPSERHELPAINSSASEPAATVASLRRREPPAATAPAPAPAPASASTTGPAAGDIVMGAQANTEGAPTRGLALSPTSAVRGIFPTSKSRSLKKKSSILAKRRMVPARALAARGAAGGVWQRVRARAAAAPRWARRHLLLAHNLLYAYRSPECSRADCMIYLEGFTVSAAAEVKSRAHSFKVYHTGTAFYFACDSREAQLAWIQLIHRATLLPSLATNMDVSKQFSETDYSETESDAESPHKERERLREGDKDKDKDKSKFGSLKKLTHRMQRSDSHESVPHSSTSLDRKYLRFFYRNKTKDDAKLKSKQSGVPVPTEHYRSYRRVAPPDVSPAGVGVIGSAGAGAGAGGVGSAGAGAEGAGPVGAGSVGAVDSSEESGGRRRLPKPINYIHASNPNLLDFDNSNFVTKPTLHVPKPKPKTENLVGFVTLEQFMLKKQAEERRQVYTNRVLMGVEHQQRAQQHELLQRLDNIVPDVIYGEVGAAEAGSSNTGSSTGGGKPISVRGKDGYEKIVYLDEGLATSGASSGRAPAGGPSPGRAPTGGPSPGRTVPGPAPDRWRDSLRRNDKVHTTSVPAMALQLQPAPHSRSSPAGSPAEGARRRGQGGAVGPGPGAAGAGAGGAGAGAGPRRGAHYPHLQCPPTFQPETYSLSRLPPRDADA